MTSSSDWKSDLQRLATYRYLSDNGATVFYSRLSRLGYVYSGRGLDIECEACRSRVQIHEDDWLITRSRLRHESGCVFESLLNDLEGEFEGVNLLVGQAEIAEGNRDNYSGAIQVVNCCPCDLDVDGAFPGNVGSSAGSTSNTKATPRIHDGLNCSSPTADCKTWVYCDMSEFSDYPDLFQPECLEVDSPENINNYTALERSCDKNPGHFGYFIIPSLKLEQIPKKFRCPEILIVLKVMSDLTVRIIVSTTSSNRRNGNQHKVKVGTGFVIENIRKDKRYSKNSSWASKLNIMSGDNAGLVFIQTSRHLVYNNEEAENTTVEFFYDNSDRKEIVSLEGKYLLNSTTTDDSQCLLVCECPDSGFIKRLNRLQQEFYGVAERLSLKAKKGMSKKLFMVHHPHGGPKVLAYGDYTIVKYQTVGTRSRPDLTRITKHSQVGTDVSEYRKTLFYAADTCPGSCGAPILTFRARQSEANGDVTFKLDIWMHNGVETSHKLGASNLKACTLLELELTTMNVTHEDLSTIPDNASSASPKVSSSGDKVIGLSAYPQCTSQEARLASFQTWSFGHIQPPERLAASGFFHTGGGDCVRCFQCGIGLRSWKKEDDVNAQHRKYSLTCPFMMTIDHQEVFAGTMTLTDSGNNLTEGIEIKLLEAENRTLKNQLTCKVCLKSDIKDVFLPCGELYACSECSKLLTHCPSCGKQILATVTVFLT